MSTPPGWRWLDAIVTALLAAAITLAGLAVQHWLGYDTVLPPPVVPATSPPAPTPTEVN